MLKINSKSLAVVRLQMQLRQLDYYDGLITGVFSIFTDAAVRKFQERYNLTIDGIVGQKTQTVLNTLASNGYHTLFIHCAASPDGLHVPAQNIVNFHTFPKSKGGRGWSRPGYSDVIELSGKLVNIYAYNQDNFIHEWEQTWGVHGSTLLNRNARHICYIGGLAADNKTPKDTRTPEQTETLKNYVLSELEKNPKLIISGHDYVQNKACPSFDVPEWLSQLGVPEFNIPQWSKSLRI